MLHPVALPALLGREGGMRAACGAARREAQARKSDAPVDHLPRAIFRHIIGTNKPDHGCSAEENAMRRSSFLALFSMGSIPGAREGREGARSRTARRWPLRATLAILTFGIGLVATSSVVVAHHSVAMFDREHPIQLVGVVREFKFVNPHAFIALEVAGKDAPPVMWNLEGDSTNSLKWDGWSSQTLKPGDELRITVEPLRSGAPGGVWHSRTTTYKDGTPVAVIRGK